MNDELWHQVYHGIVAGYEVHGTCAACEYDGPSDWFRVWHKGSKTKVLCAQCSGDVSGTMKHEGWERER